MVEYVEGVEAELSLDALCDCEALRQGHVGEESAWTKESVESGVADRTASGQRERTRNRADVVGQRSNRGEVIPLAVDFLGTDAERLSWNHVRTAWAGVFDQA